MGRAPTSPSSGDGDAYAHRISYSRGADGRAPPTFQSEKQRMLNQIEVGLCLRLSQVQSTEEVIPMFTFFFSPAFCEL